MEITSENYFKLKEQKLSRAEIANNLNIPEWKLKRLISANGWGKPASIIEFEDTFKEEINTLIQIITKNNAVKIDFLKYVSVVFTTPLKQDCIMEIDLTDEKKYEHFLYS